MNRSACGIVVLLLLSLAVPALGRNYQLHSPKLWSQQEKEQYEKENPPAVIEKVQAEQQAEQLKKELENSEKQKKQFKKDKEQAEKHKEELKIEKELVKREKERIRESQIQVKDGVSYREVTVQNGDTLFGISRKFRQEGSLYSETIRFNDIKAPYKIVSGDVIKVPLFRDKKVKESHSVKQKLPKPATVAQKTPTTAKAVIKTMPAKSLSESISSKKAILPPEAIIIKVPAEVHSAPDKISILQPQTPANNSTNRQKLYELAIKSYRNGDCQTAIQLFGRFLAENSPSALAADASMFIADCYIKLSGK